MKPRVNKEYIRIVPRAEGIYGCKVRWIDRKSVGFYTPAPWEKDRKHGTPFFSRKFVGFASRTETMQAYGVPE